MNLGVRQVSNGVKWGARMKSNSSGRWLQRQLDDFLVKQSKTDHYRSRAAYKLIELDKKFRLFNKNTKNIVDLGFAPGAWTQVAIERCKKLHVHPANILGIDLINCSPPEGSHFIQGDILSKQTHQDIRHHFGGASLHPVDLVMSDMMSNTSGIKDNDHYSSMDLCDAAIILSYNLLTENGNLVMKFFTGKEDELLMVKLQKMFKNVYRMKPSACRNESREMYVIAMKRKNINVLLTEILLTNK